MVATENLKVKRTYKNTFLIKCDIVPDRGERVRDYIFDILVSYHDQSGFERLTSIDGTSLSDHTIRFEDLYREYNLNRVRYYKISTIEKASGNVVYESPLAYIGSRSSGVHNVIRYGESVLNNLYTGTPCVLLRRMSNEQMGRCPQCWDRVTRQIALSHCSVCYGTGFVGGYYPPINVQVAINNVQKKSVPTDAGEDIYNTEVHARFSSFPIVKPKDVLIDTESGKRYIISNLVKITKLPELSTFSSQKSGGDGILSQIFALRELVSDDVVYDINPDNVSGQKIKAFGFEVLSEAFKPSAQTVGFNINYTKSPDSTEFVDILFGSDYFDVGAGSDQEYVSIGFYPSFFQVEIVE